MTPLHFVRLDEPGEVPTNGEIFLVLGDVLQPDTGISLDSAAKRIAEMLPEGEIETTEMRHFCASAWTWRSRSHMTARKWRSL